MKIKRTVAALLVLIMMTAIISALAGECLRCPQCDGAFPLVWSDWKVVYRYFEIGPAEMKHEVQSRTARYQCESCPYRTPVVRTETRDIRLY